MRKIVLFITLPLILAACNSVYVKPNTLDKSKTVYAADTGGYAFKRSAKEVMEKRGYNVVVGKLIKKSDRIDSDSGDDIIVETYNTMGADYVLKVRERRERFIPVWCALNGFWWWNYNASISDQKTGSEIMTWRGRGCANSSMRKFDSILDKMEIH